MNDSGIIRPWGGIRGRNYSLDVISGVYPFIGFSLDIRMISALLTTRSEISPSLLKIAGPDSCYEVRLAENACEVASAMRLRHKVFNVEIGGRANPARESNLEFDAYDFKCRHLIVVSTKTNETVGTYRLSGLDSVRDAKAFYSANEFSIGELPSDVLHDGIEIGRACVAKEHRNTKVLFLLWKGLLHHLQGAGKRYFFGCCSIFTQDEEIGAAAFRKLQLGGYLHDQFRVSPLKNSIELSDTVDTDVKLPSLFNMYLRIGARVCGPPMIDREFGTIDFFVVFDVTKMNEKYRRMFAA